MKKLFILLAITLFISPLFGQTLKKGGVITAFTMTVALQPDVTMDHYLNFLETKFLPETEKKFTCELHLVKGLNREIKDQYGIIWYYSSKEIFNKYWNDDGSATEAGQSALDELNPLSEELNQLGTFTFLVNDWVLQ